MIRFCASVLLAVFLLSSNGPAQQAPSPGPLAPSDTSSFAATLGSLIDSCNVLQTYVRDGKVSEQHHEDVLPTIERILDCLDLSQLPTELRSTAGVESALYLKEILDRTEIPDVNEIPGVASPSDSTTAPIRWQIPGTRIAIARVELEPGQVAYLFTPATVRRAAEYYRVIKPLPYRSEGRPVSPDLHDTYIAATKERPTRTADTSSPRGTFTLFFDACTEIYELINRERYFDREDPEFDRIAQRIISCLDTSQLPEYARQYFDGEAAVCLKEVLDRVSLPPEEVIPGPESIETGEGGAALLRWQVPRTQIVITKMETGPRRGEYLFSAGTVSRAPELYDKVRTVPYRTTGRQVTDGFYEWWLSSPGNPGVAALLDRLPGWFQLRRGGLALWQWCGLLPAIPISLLLMFLAFRTGKARGDQVRGKNLLGYWLSLGFPILALTIPFAFKHYVWVYLNIRGDAVYAINFCADVILLLGLIWLIIQVSGRIAESIIALPQIAPGGLDANLIRLIGRVLGIAAAVIMFLEGGRYLGFPITTLIASAGIGGLAIALSAQGLIKGLFGTVSILLDKPYRVGDRIVVHAREGIVEEIGLRSTKIRAMNNHLISIPNDQMADAEIENIGKRTHARRKTEIHIPLDTPRAQVEEAVQCIRAALDNHEGMDPKFPPRVYFAEFSPGAFTIKIYYWFTPPDEWKFMEFSEKINMQIFAAFEDRGIQFSLPARHSYWKEDDQQGPLEIVLRDGSDQAGKPNQTGQPRIAPMPE